MIPRFIVTAAPTCTLWIYDPIVQALRFRFWRRWTIADRELAQ